jgi:hypothetical protein
MNADGINTTKIVNNEPGRLGVQVFSLDAPKFFSPNMYWVLIPFRAMERLMFLAGIR